MPLHLWPAVTWCTSTYHFFQKFLSHFPQIQTIFTSVIFLSSQTCIHAHYNTAMEHGCLVRIMFLLIVGYVHHICQMTLMTQNAFLFNQWSPWLKISWITLWSYMPCQWFSHHHRLACDMIRNCITCLFKFWLWFQHIINNWHVTSIIIHGSRH